MANNNKNYSKHQPLMGHEYKQRERSVMEVWKSFLLKKTLNPECNSKQCCIGPAILAADGIN